MTMTVYEPTRLKRWTHPENYFGEVWPNYYSAGVGRSRDSDALEESNFVSMLELLGGESETVQVVRERHWAVGWVEWIAIHQDDGEALAKADKARADLDNYPVLNEDHWSNLEWERAADWWDSLKPRETVQQAMWVRERYHWLKDTPCWPYGRLDFHALANRGDTISEALYEIARE